MRSGAPRWRGGREGTWLMLADAKISYFQQECCCFAVNEPNLLEREYTYPRLIYP